MVLPVPSCMVIELVKKSWSPYYTKYGNSEKHHSEFVSAEKEAKKDSLNIWGCLICSVNKGRQTNKINLFNVNCV